MFISSSLQPGTGGWSQIVALRAEHSHFNIQAEGQCSLRQAIIYGYNNSSNRKQRLKSKKQIQQESELTLPCYSNTFSKQLVELPED